MTSLPPSYLLLIVFILCIFYKKHSFPLPRRSFFVKLFGYLFKLVSKQEHCEEDSGKNVGCYANFLNLTGAELDYYVREQAEADTERDVVGKGHHYQRQKSGDRYSEVVPVNIFDGSHHQQTHRGPLLPFALCC